MDENSTPEVVTEDEAVDKVKLWIQEMNWEKAIEGCKEILEIDPNNEDIKGLLTQAEKGLAERPTEAVKPAEMVSDKAAEVAPKTEPEVATPPPQQPAQVETPQPAAAPAAPTPEPAVMPQRKSKSTVMIAAIVGFLILALLIIALVLGWLNPVFDWLFGLIG